MRQGLTAFQRMPQRNASSYREDGITNAFKTYRTARSPPRCEAPPMG